LIDLLMLKKQEYGTQTPDLFADSVRLQLANTTGDKNERL